MNPAEGQRRNRPPEPARAPGRRPSPANMIAAISATLTNGHPHLHVAADLDAVVVQPGQRRIRTIANICPYLDFERAAVRARGAAEWYKIPRLSSGKKLVK